MGQDTAKDLQGRKKW